MYLNPTTDQLLTDPLFYNITAGDTGAVTMGFTITLTIIGHQSKFEKVNGLRYISPNTTKTCVFNSLAHVKIVMLKNSINIADIVDTHTRFTQQIQAMCSKDEIKTGGILLATAKQLCIRVGAQIYKDLYGAEALAIEQAKPDYNNYHKNPVAIKIHHDQKDIKEPGLLFAGGHCVFVTPMN